MVIATKSPEIVSLLDIRLILALAGCDDVQRKRFDKNLPFASVFMACGFVDADSNCACADMIER